MDVICCFFSYLKILIVNKGGNYELGFVNVIT